MKITHIGPDSQFLTFTSELFEAAAPGANNFIIVGGSRHGRLNHPIPHGHVRVVSSGALNSFRMLWLSRNSDMIIAHSMTPHSAIVFLCSPAKTKKVWSGWGFDYYGLDEDPSAGLLGPSTAALVKPPARRDVGLALQLRGRFLRRISRWLTRKAAVKADYFSAPIPSDFDIFKRRFPEFGGEYIQINYGNVIDTFAVGAEPSGGSDILVGNSASFTNNHLEAFDLLATQDLRGRKVIVPLSYGDPDYRQVVVNRGTELFGAAFTPLIEFLALSEYVSLVSRCSVVIMNHKRQQGLGNIGAALYHGAHVFIHESSPTVDFLESLGAVFGTTDQLATQRLPHGRLSESAIAKNRSALESFWGSKQVVRNVQQLVTRINR